FCFQTEDGIRDRNITEVQTCALPIYKSEEEQKQEEEKKKIPLQFDKPDAVRGIYLTGHSAGGENFDKLVDLINHTDLNSMVIDMKDDYGDLTYEPDKKSDLVDFGNAYR